ncbi:hypothetical protein BDV28DRAFT_131077 [Aspergillus coremiiformis]|uniref:NAD(P)-binding domain-containing protein n=1 Tax=Aspergillus coremiiformis TaxID=138285 RepID=A0A5N6Z9S4_9EURO|nr:hypothetical protein BDV28DRAFT_131077 [Aspergillus coremiiformis]
MANLYAKNQPPTFKNEIQRVAIIGAGGSIGKPIAQALLKTEKHIVTALTRVDSQNTLPEGVQAVPVNYDDEATLVSALKGQDALIISLAATAPPDTQSKVVQAAAKAGVKYVMPNVWGVDVMNEALRNSELNLGHLHAAFAEIEKLGVSSWIGLVCGFWYEHSFALGPNSFGFDFATKKLVLFDDGETKTNISTLAQCGRAVARLLSLKVLPEDEHDRSLTLSRWLNKPVYVSSFFIHQKDMFESWKRVTGDTGRDWTVEYQSSRERYKKGLERMKNGDWTGYTQALYSRAFFPNGDGDFEHKYGLANEVLGLPLEDLDEYTKTVKAMVDRGYNYVTIRD